MKLKMNAKKRGQSIGNALVHAKGSWAQNCRVDAYGHLVTCIHCKFIQKKLNSKAILLLIIIITTIQ